MLNDFVNTNIPFTGIDVYSWLDSKHESQVKESYYWLRPFLQNLLCICFMLRFICLVCGVYGFHNVLWHDIFVIQDQKLRTVFQEKISKFLSYRYKCLYILSDGWSIPEVCSQWHTSMVLIFRNVASSSVTTRAVSGPDIIQRLGSAASLLLWSLCCSRLSSSPSNEKKMPWFLDDKLLLLLKCYTYVHQGVFNGRAKISRVYIATRALLHWSRSKNHGANWSAVWKRHCLHKMTSFVPWRRAPSSKLYASSWFVDATMIINYSMFENPGVRCL